MVVSGLPETRPVMASNDNPVSDVKLGAIVNVVLPLPPADVTGINAVIVLFLVNGDVGTDKATVSVEYVTVKL